MKHFLRKAALLLTAFLLVIAAALIFSWYRNRQTESYTTMPAASLPVVRLGYQSGCSNLLTGYLDQMDCASMRGTITPLKDRRKLDLTIETFGNTPDQVSYELRSTDGSRLVDDGILEEWTLDEGVMTKEIQLTNLIESGTEYMLVICLKTGTSLVRYYGRVIYFKEGNTDAMLSFLFDFTEAAFSKNSELIINYIQPNDTMGTDDYSYVNIHSRYRMFVWEGADAELAGDISVRLTDLTDSQMTAVLTFPMTLSYEGVTKQYTAEEIFTVRYRNDTIYLLDFERYLTEEFSLASLTGDSGKLYIGISAKDSQTMFSPDGKTEAFIYEGQLWSYEATANCITPVFTYQNGDDVRCTADRYEEKLIRVQNDGTIDFTVSGYHSRGEHEGHVGICFYRYHKENGWIEELFYIPSDCSEEVLLKEMTGLTYVSGNDLLYFIYGNTIYSVDLAAGEVMELASRDSSNHFYYNDNADVVAWQESDSQIDAVNLEIGTLQKITAGEGETLEIQGFVGDALIYGVKRASDAGRLDGVQRVSPMCRLIFAEIGDELTEVGRYEKQYRSIFSVELLENEIKVSTLIKNGAAYTTGEEEQIFLNVRDEKAALGNVQTVLTDGFLKEKYFSLSSGTSSLSLAKEAGCFLEGAEVPTLAADLAVLSENMWYAYGKGSLVGIYEDLSDAIQAAYDSMGCVVDENQNYIWTRGTRDLYKNLSIQNLTCETQAQSLETCLKIFLSMEGASASGLEEDLAAGLGTEEILKACMDGTVLDLTGCTCAQLAYYLNLGHAVIAVTGNNTAVILCGYATGTVTIYDPYTGLSTDTPTADADSYFESCGSIFYTCLS